PMSEYEKGFSSREE
ncbi:hypothetical protein KIPB_015939, partial [Kipferlia bialata]